LPRSFSHCCSSVVLVVVLLLNPLPPVQLGDRAKLTSERASLQAERDALRRRQDELRGQVKATMAGLHKAGAELAGPQYNGVRLAIEVRILTCTVSTAADLNTIVQLMVC